MIISSFLLKRTNVYAGQLIQFSLKDVTNEEID